MKPVDTVAYVGALKGSRHKVTYIDNTTEQVTQVTIRAAMRAAGVYCTPVWPPPFVLPPPPRVPGEA